MRGLQHRSQRTAAMPRRWYWMLVTAIAAAAALLRFWHSERPGYDVDESVYEYIAANFASGGDISAKPEYIDPAGKLYTSHPPFPFMLLGAWFRVIGSAGLVEARWLSAAMSVLTVVVLAGFMRRLIGDWALLASALVALDGWITFTNRVGWLENYQFPLGIAAMWLYLRLSDRPTRMRLALAGAALGLVVAFKHVGVYFLIAAIVHRMITSDWQPNTPRRIWAWLWAAVRSLKSPLGIAAVLVMIAYVWGMALWAGPQYLSASKNQILRALGLVESRGAVKGTGDIVGPLLNQYGIYVATVLVLALAGILVGVRVLQMLRHRSFEPLRRADPMLFAWAFSAYAVFGLAGLKLPHYLFMIMLPAYCYLVAELRYWVRTREVGGLLVDPSRLRVFTTWALCVILALSGVYATYARMVARSDNAVGQTIAWFQDKANARPGDRAVADEFIGNQIPQPYCGIKHVTSCVSRGGIPDFVIEYTTTTQKLPQDPELDALLNRSTVVATFTGFKETIKIRRVSKDS